MATNKNQLKPPGEKDPKQMYGRKPKEAASNLETAQKKLAEGKNLNSEEKRVVARKKRQDLMLQAEPGDNRKFILHDLEMMKWERIDMTDPKQVADRCAKFFQWSAEDDVKPTSAGLAVALGMDRQTMLRYANGQAGNSKEVSECVKMALAMMASQMEHFMENGKINPVAGIFLMKNSLGYRDQQEVLVKPVVPLENVTDRKQLEQRYMDSIVIEPDKIE